MLWIWLYDPDALDYDFKDMVITTKWKVDEVAEAAWGIKANQGGGYACIPSERSFRIFR